MPIASLIIESPPDRREEVRSALLSFEEVVEAEPIEEDLIVVTETGDYASDRQLWKRIRAVPGVQQSHLVYHNFEDLEETS